MSWRDAVGALLGLSTYQSAAPAASAPDEAMVDRIRRDRGGQIVQMPITQTRWYLRDLESAVHAADTGDLWLMGTLYRSMVRDGVLAGLLSTRTGGLVCLPKKFSGDPEIKSVLEERNGTRSTFDDMLPPSELALLAADGIVCGVGVGELLPVQGRDFPVLCRLDPAYLRYRWTENRWYYSSIAGQLPIEPGDGRWVLHTAGGRLAPWQNGLWQALGRAWIHKEHAMQFRANWESKLANPARVATSPLGASEGQRQGWLAQIMGWSANSVFELPSGYAVSLLESNGRGYESFQATISSSDLEYTIALTGNTVTTDGGTGFANADVHKSIRADLIQSTADLLAHTVNTQCLPPFIAANWGVGRLQKGTVVEWDTTPPKDLKAAAESMNQMGQAITALTAALQPYKIALDIQQLATRFNIPIMGDDDGDGLVDDNSVQPDAPAQIEPAPVLQ